MKSDVINLSNLKFTEKRPSKDTLNHPELIRLASGIDPFENTREALRAAYESLGIDLINRMPEKNVPPPLKEGETLDNGNGYMRAHLGLFDSYCRHVFTFKDVDDFWDAPDIDPDYNTLEAPLQYALDVDEIKRKMSIVGDAGIYFYLLHTTLFMWGVEYLGWEVFMLAAISDPDGFKEKFLDRVFTKSLELVRILSEIDSPFVFCHDDLVDVNGPIFPPWWYEKYIFPYYEKLWAPAKKAGKKVIFIADGNMTSFLKPILDTGVDGVMFENPATDFDAILKYFGDKIIIGGIETMKLMYGKPDEIERHVLEVHEKTKGMPGFAMSTPGGIHGSVPLENLEKYFDTRVKTGHTKEGWRRL